MGRLIFVPQYPVPMRYQSWWFKEFPKQFKKHYDEVIVLGERSYFNFDATFDQLGPNFSPTETAIEFEMEQMKEYMDMKVYSDDTLFLADLSFPGMFLNILAHKPLWNVYAFVHATAINRMDYFERVRGPKFDIEIGQARFCKKLFVASQYHKDKIGPYMGDNKIVNIGALPINPILGERRPIKNIRKKNMVVSVSRICPQRVDKNIEDRIEEELKIKIIHKNDFSSWDEYYDFLEESQILLITTREETYGYASMEAACCCCTPLVPNNFSYPELFNLDCRWDSPEELIHKIGSFRFSSNPFPYNFAPKNAPKQASFYQTIVSHMKGTV